jgi:predicted dehydrogenase
VIGCGVWGRKIFQTLARLRNAPVVAIYDSYEAAFRRAKEAAPDAETFTDFKKLLEKKEVHAVIVATNGICIAKSSKSCWRRAAANPEREQAVNWQISAATSPGLVGELDIHQLDMICWLLNTRPLGVYGWGSILNWKDGRDVADTIQAVFEFPDGVNYCADAALTASFDSSY